MENDLRDRAERLTIAPLERHMTDEGQAMLQWILRNAAAVDLTAAQK